MNKIYETINANIQRECMIPGRGLKKYRIIYNLNHRNMGFNNSLTVGAFSPEHAIELVKLEVAGVYGSDMLKKFSFKPDPTYTGVVAH